MESASRNGAYLLYSSYILFEPRWYPTSENVVQTWRQAGVIAIAGAQGKRDCREIANREWIRRQNGTKAWSVRQARLSTIVNARSFSSRRDAYRPIAPSASFLVTINGRADASLAWRSIIGVKRGCQFVEARFANLSHGENRERH